MLENMSDYRFFLVVGRTTTICFVYDFVFHRVSGCSQTSAVLGADKDLTFPADRCSSGNSALVFLR